MGSKITFRFSDMCRSKKPEMMSFGHTILFNCNLLSLYGYLLLPSFTPIGVFVLSTTDLDNDIPKIAGLKVYSDIICYVLFGCIATI